MPIFGKPHQEALELLKGKAIVSKEAFDELLPEIKSRAFTISGVTSADQMQRIRDTIADIAQGKTWDQAKSEIVDSLQWENEKDATRRAEILLRTHGFMAFQAANWNAAQKDDDTTHLQYMTTEDDRVRNSHRALNGLILPKNDPFWQTHFPPWEWGCRCNVRSINPDLLDIAKEQDKDRNPEDKLVMEGPALEQLRNGTLIRNGQSFNVTPSIDKPDNGKPKFHWNPGDLKLPIEDLKKRYAPPVWRDFVDKFSKIEAHPRQTVIEWLEGKTPPPATLENEEKHAARLSHEVGCIFDAVGNQVFRQMSFENKVVFPNTIAPSSVITHNHPSGLPPSPNDWKLLAKHDVTEFRVVIKDGTWIVKRPANGWPSDEKWQEILVNADHIAAQPNGPHQLVDFLRTMLDTEIRLADHGEILSRE